MTKAPVVIVVECREPGESDSVIAFVGSSWTTVDTFVSDKKNHGFSSDPNYFWWAQENFVDNTDIVSNCGRVRTYDKTGVLLNDDNPLDAASWHRMPEGGTLEPADIDDRDS